MGVTSKTGLLASPTKKVIKPFQRQAVELKVIAKSAPYILKPFAGLYNPYSHGCSLLCNHPADTEARNLLRRARDTWATEGKNLLLVEEINAIRQTLENFQVTISECEDFKNHDSNGIPIGSVPEELFRRYTETDSRPLTPAPTLISAHTRASGSRRCVTPDPMHTSEVREKTMLILDLRRSHSQETLSWHGTIQQQQPVPSITILKAPRDKRSLSTPYTSTLSPDLTRKRSARNAKSASPSKTSRSELDQHDMTYLNVDKKEADDTMAEEEEEEEEMIKRRGKKRRKRGRDASREPPAFQTSIDPETQIATIGPESHNPSARTSLVPTDSVGRMANLDNRDATDAAPINKAIKRQNSLEIDSFLDVEVLKLLRRQLNEEAIDVEFNLKKRKALEEALKTIRPNKPECEELKQLRKDLKLSPVNEELLINIPRMFSRSSVRFELPMDSREFGGMTPLSYIEEHVIVTSSRKLLYNSIFNRHKNDNEIDNEHQRLLLGKSIVIALNEMMGKAMSEAQIKKYRELIGWNDEDLYDFKTFCGLCALCERVLGPELYPQMPDKKFDPCHEIETVDFKSLERRLEGQNVDERLVKILFAIRNS